MRGGWDADSDERDEGCPGGVAGTGDAGAGVPAAFLSGGNCDLDSTPGAVDGVREGPAAVGESKTFRLGMNC